MAEAETYPTRKEKLKIVRQIAMRPENAPEGYRVIVLIRGDKLYSRVVKTTV